MTGASPPAELQYNSKYRAATLQLCNSATLQLCNSATLQLIPTNTTKTFSQIYEIMVSLGGDGGQGVLATRVRAKGFEEVLEFAREVRLEKERRT